MSIKYLSKLKKDIQLLFTHLKLNFNHMKSNMNKVTIMLQARINSKRLPGKVIASIVGKPMIWHIINRLKHVNLADQIILLLTKQPSHKYDYVSNTLKPTYPDGLDVEIFSFKTLQQLEKLTTKKSDREHVTSFIMKNKTRFKTFNFENKKDLSDLRLTVDEKNDLTLVRKIYTLMKPNTLFSLKTVLTLLKKNPTLLNINRNIMRNEGYLISINSDKEVNKK